MEMGGTVYITCEKTGLQSEIEFKTKVCAVMSCVNSAACTSLDWIGPQLS